MKYNVPKTILDVYGKIHLDNDIMYVNKITFFTAMLEHIRLIYCTPIKYRLKHRVKYVLEINRG